MTAPLCDGRGFEVCYCAGDYCACGRDREPCSGCRNCDDAVAAEEAPEPSGPCLTCRGRHELVLSRTRYCRVEGELRSVTVVEVVACPDCSDERQGPAPISTPPVIIDLEDPASAALRERRRHLERERELDDARARGWMV